MTDLPFDGDPFEAPIDSPYLNTRVRVLMARAGQHVTACATPFLAPCRCDRLTADEAVVGTLTRLDAGGGFDIRLDSGEMRYCWPALEITKVGA